MFWTTQLLCVVFKHKTRNSVKKKNMMFTFPYKLAAQRMEKNVHCIVTFHISYSVRYDLS